MKKLILATAVTAAVVVYFVDDKDQPVNDNTVMQNPAEQKDSLVKSTNVSAAQVAVSDKSVVSESAMPSSSSDGQGYSTYNQDNNSLENERASNSSYSRYSGESDSYNDDNSSSYSDSSSDDYSSSYNSSSNSSESSDGSDSESNHDSAKSDDNEDKEKQPTEKFQRIYDNGIVWYGDTGSLEIQYQSSDPETAGIGFRLHYDSSSMKVVRVNQFPVDAIIMTSPESSRVDTNNNDANDSTNAFLTFAWASMYAQWPQATQLNLATVEFERLYTGSDNLNIDYSVISNQAGFQFIK
jgi:hypothetical protein